MLQDTIQSWLARPIPERAVNASIGLPIVLSTDLGLERKENQDRIAAFRITSKSSAGRPLVAVIVVDGMGGMREGNLCAVLAASAFFHALTVYRSQALEARVISSISYANDAVYRFQAGHGGATIAAIVIDQTRRPIVVHVGDSRAYSIDDKRKVHRLTTDDSLAEAVGGHGRELLQFVGMGPGIQPHIKQLDADHSRVLLTTDGIHYVEPSVFEQVIVNSGDLKVVVDRLTALARWCGGPDNASIAAVDVTALSEALFSESEGLQLWDAVSGLQFMWLDTEDRRNIAPVVPAHPDAGVLPEQAKPKTKTKSRSKTKGKPRPQGEVQLEIEIEQAGEPSGLTDDENSK